MGQTEMATTMTEEQKERMVRENELYEMELRLAEDRLEAYGGYEDSEEYYTDLARYRDLIG